MSVYYNGSHSITFIRINDDLSKNTWNDFYLVPSEKPYVDPPKPEFKYVNLPRSNKIIDLTESLTGTVDYEASEGSWKFYIDHERYSNYHTILEELGKFFDGTMFRIIIDDEPGADYTGTVSVESYDPENNYSTVTLAYSLNWYVEDTIPDISNDDPVIKIPRIGSKSDYYTRIPIIQNQIIAITTIPDKPVYYVQLNRDTKTNTYSASIEQYDSQITISGYSLLETTHKISDGIEISEDALYPSHPFTDEKYLDSFSLGITATYVIPIDQYVKDADSACGDNAAHFNIRDDSAYNSYNSGYSRNGKTDYDDPDNWIGTDDNGDYPDGYADEGPGDNISNFRYSIPFRVALKIANANDESYVGCYMTFGSGSDIFANPFILHSPTQVDRNVEVGDGSGSYTTIDGITAIGDKVNIHTATHSTNTRRTTYKYSNGYYVTEPSGLCKFNLNGNKNYTSYITKGLGNSYTRDDNYYVNKEIAGEFDLSFLKSEYGIEFDTTKLYLYRTSSVGEGQYLVSIDRYT